MPVEIDIFDFKCFNQLRNGSDFDRNLSEFTPNLVGNIGETVKVEYTANIVQYAFTEGLEEWELFSSLNEVRRSSGSFLDDAIQVGDVYFFYSDWDARKDPGAMFDYIGSVSFVSTDGRTLRYTLLSGTEPADGIVTNVGMAFDQKTASNENTALFVRFGLLENDETFNNISKVTGSQQVYYAGGLSEGNTTEAESLGSIKDWVSGNMQIEFTNVVPDFRAAQYKVFHEFVINPFYILAFRDFINSNTIPDLLAGDSSLKYAVELEFRKTLTNTGSSKIQDFDNLEGFIGWYDENFNGLNTDYRVLSTSYAEESSGDPLDGININTATVATITIENINSPITDYSCGVYLFRVPTSEDQYIGTTSNLLDNFLFKSEVVSSPDTSSPNISTSLVSGNLVIEYTIDYTTAEKLRLTTDDEYILLVQIEDPTISAGNSDRVMLISDFRNYVDIDFLNAFIDVQAYNFYVHGQSPGESEPSPGLVLSNEDGIFLDAVFGSDVTKDVVINSIAIDLVAFNQFENRSFQLDTYPVNIGDLVTDNGLQQLEVDTTRGYPLPPGDQFNLVKITTLGPTGDFQIFSLQVGQKIKWQEWNFNPGVDNVFFDPSEPNNNLNEKSSNYSGLNGYSIHVALVLNVTGVDDLGRTVTGNFTNYGGVLEINDYDESSDGVTGVIQTFDLETNQSLGGDILYNGKDTLFKAIFQNASDMIYGIHRIEPFENPGDGILELSNLLPSVSGNLLKPLEGETQLSFDLDGSELTTQCIIDGSLIQEGLQYKLSARVGSFELPMFTSRWDTENISLGSSANNQIRLPLIASGVYNFTVNWGDGNSDDITAFDQPEVTHTYDTPGEYDIEISGVCQGWSFNFDGDRLKLLTISQWAIFQPISLGVFSGCANLNVTATDTLDLSQTDTLLSFFEGCSSLVFNDSISTWDTSNIISLSRTFLGCSLFNQNVNAWNTSLAESMSSCFQDCSIFNQPLENWSLSSCEDLNQMFFGALIFNQPLENWERATSTLANVTSFASMFRVGVFNQSLTTWNTSSVESIAFMFRENTQFNSDISGWILSSCTNMEQVFNGNTSFNQPLSNWERVDSTLANVTNFRAMFQFTIFNQDISNWNTSSVQRTDLMFNENSVFNQDISLWNFANVTNANSMLRRCFAFDQNIGAWNTSSLSTAVDMLTQCIVFNRSLGSWDISSLTTADGFLNGCDALSSANLDDTLIDWAAQIPSVQANVIFDAENTARTAASDTAVTSLTSAPYNWTINTL